MRIDTTDHFIHIQFDVEDFRFECGHQPYNRFLMHLKEQIDEQDRYFEPTDKVWMVTNTPKNLEIVKTLKRHYFES